MERKKAKNLKISYLKIFLLFSLERNHLYVCLKVLRHGKRNEVVRPIMTIIYVPRDDSA